MGWRKCKKAMIIAEIEKKKKKDSCFISLPFKLISTYKHFKNPSLCEIYIMIFIIKNIF